MTSPYAVPVGSLDEVHVPREDQVEETDPFPPNPVARTDEERERDTLLRIGGAGL